MTIGNRVTKAREKAGISKADLARATGLSKQAIGQIESGATKSPIPENLFKIARALNVSAEWIITGKNIHGEVNDEPESYKVIRAQHNTRPAQISEMMIPVVSSVQAGQWTESFDTTDLNDDPDLIVSPISTGGNAFALRVQGDSMVNPHDPSSSVPHGMIIIIDPERNWGSGDLVVAKIDASSEATFKKLIIEGEKKYLMPLNPQYPRIDIDGDCRIVGKVVAHIKTY